MSLENASQQALLQASLKDDFYLQILRGQLTHISQQLLGAKLWLSWKKELEVISDLMYFFLTTIKGSQTLGEEYASIIQVDSSKRKIPAQLQRILYVLLNCTSPYIFEKSLNMLERKVESSKGISSVQRKRVIVLIRLIHQLIPVVQKLHLVLFYVDGLFANISLRVSKIKHVLIRPYNADESDNYTFRWLAIMLSIQATSSLLSIVSTTKREFLEVKEECSDISRKDVALRPNSQMKCMLCLDFIQNASTTVCGHLFCWNCIVEWCTVKPECPSCRERCPASKIVILHHFVPNVPVKSPLQDNT